MPKALKWLSVIATICMLFVLVGGALVTKTGSFDGCGNSWPLCEGELIPTQLDFEKIIELSHRLVSGSAAIIVTLLAIWAWRRIGHIREVKFLSFLSVFFLVLQALIGAAAVIWQQSPPILALHFGISLISFAAVFLLMLLIFEIDKKFNAKALIIDKNMRFHIWSLLIYSYLVVYTGALVRHEKATLACLKFPFCQENRLMPNNILEWVQMGHRFAAFILFFWIVYLVIKVLKHHKSKTVLFSGVLSVFILACLQIITGVATVFTYGNLYMALLHALVITVLFSVLTYLALLASRSKRYELEKK